MLILMFLVPAPLMFIMGYINRMRFYLELEGSCSGQQCFLAQNNTCEKWNKMTRKLDAYFESEWPRMDLMIR